MVGGVGLASVVADATVEGVDDVDELAALVGEDATGDLDPPLQPESATTTSRAQTGPMVRTRRA